MKPDETHIAVGMSDGTLSVRRRQPKASEGALAHGPLSGASLRAAKLESFLGGVLPNIGQPRIRDRTKSKPVGDVYEFKVESRRRRRLKEYDRLLKGFKYSAALDSALRKVSTVVHLPQTRLKHRFKRVPPATTFALIQELIYRDGLWSALAGRDDVLLEPILRLLLKYVTDPRFGGTACDVAGLIIGASPCTNLTITVAYVNVTLPQRYIPRCSANPPLLIPCSCACGENSKLS